MATEWISPTWRMPEDSNQSKFENYSLDFDAASSQGIDIGKVPSLQSTTAYSISFWFKTPSTLTDHQAIYSWIDGADGQLQLVFSANGSFIVYNYETAAARGTSAAGVVSTDTWYNGIVIFDGTFTDGDPATQNAGRLKVYIDGNLISPLTFTGTIPAQTGTMTGGSGGTTKFLRIGNHDGGAWYFDGKIADFSIFDYALSADQISYLYNSGTPVNPMAIAGNAPVVYYPLGGSSTGDAADPATTLTVPNNSVPSATVFDFTSNLQYIRTSNFGSVFSGKTAFSFSGWFKLNSLSVSQSLFNIYDGSDNYFGINTYSNQLRFNIDYANATAFAYVNQAQLLTGTDTWFHYAGYFDGSKVASADRVKVYINGTPATLIFVGTPPTSFGTIPATANTQIGDESSSGFYGFDPTGSASNIQLWDINLSEPEITTLYNNGTPLLTGTQPQAANLKAWWKLNVDDSTWNGSDWIIEDSSVTSQIPNYTKALSKTGYGANYLNCSNTTLSFDNSAELTSSFWMKTTKTGVFGIAMGVVGMGGLRYKTNQLAMARGAHNYRNFGADTGFVNDGNWHHILLYSPGYARFDIDSVRIFIDGIEYSVGGTGYTITAPTWCVNSNYARVGTGCGWHGQGTLVASNVAVWESDQTSNISTIYNNGTPPLSYSTNPSLWWTLTDISTSVGGGWYDSSGNGNDSGGVTYSPTVVDTNVLTIGNFGLSDGMTTANLVASNLTRSIPYSSYSMYFDAIDDEIELATAVRPVNVMTVSQWLKAPASGHGFGYSIATDGLNASWGGFSFYHASATSLQFQIQTASTPFLSTAINIDDNAWHHVVGVYDGVDIRIYLDGIDQGSPTAATGDITYDVTTHTEVMIGNYPTGNYDFNGNISNTAIWHRALTANEVLTVYNGGVPNDISSLAPFGWWSLAGDSYYDGTDWICPDLGSGGNNGTSSGLATTSLIGDGPGSTANGISGNMNIPANLKGDAPNSTNNAFSVNMDTQSRVAV